MGALLESIPIEQIMAIRGYTTQDYKAINSSMRGYVPRDEHGKDTRELKDPKLRVEPAELLKQLKPYINLATVGLSKLPRHHGTVYRSAHIKPGPVWVLTSQNTFSGGEELAYDVQTLKRGRLVGETTGGGAHHNQMVRVGGHFVMSVPVGTVESPVTHTSWEAVGVKPDVAVAADRALDVALAEARKMLGQH